MLLDVGLRLKEERERLGLSQAALGAVGGVKQLAQHNYEKGVRAPDAAYLISVSKIGIDIMFILTGVPSMTSLLDDEVKLLDEYRAAPFALKAAAHATLTADLSGGAERNKPSPRGDVTISGNNNNYIGGKIKKSVVGAVANNKRLGKEPK